MRDIVKVSASDEDDIEVLLTCGHTRAISASARSLARVTTLRSAECFRCERDAKRKGAA